MRRLVVAGLLVLSTGCYTFEPAPPEPPFGAQVRAQLTNAGALRYMEKIPTHEGRVVEGNFLLLDGSEILLDVRVQRAFDPRTQREFVQRDTVAIPRSDVEEMQLREFSAARTAVVVVAGAAVVGAFVNSALGSGGGGSEDGDGDSGTQTAVLRLIRIPFR